LVVHQFEIAVDGLDLGHCGHSGNQTAAGWGSAPARFPGKRMTAGPPGRYTRSPRQAQQMVVSAIASRYTCGKSTAKSLLKVETTARSAQWPRRIPAWTLFAPLPTLAVLVKAHQPSAPPSSSRSAFPAAPSVGSLQYELGKFMIITTRRAGEKRHDGLCWRRSPGNVDQEDASTRGPQLCRHQSGTGWPLETTCRYPPCRFRPAHDSREMILAHLILHRLP
jgi:hypothetical protein